jgi:hypothetical protein
MIANLASTHDEHEWSFVDSAVTQLIVDPGGFRFVVWSLEGSIEVRVGVPFTLRAANQTSSILDPECASDLAPTLDLLQVDLATIRVRRSGELRIDFANGAVLSVEPHPAYEAWEINGTGTMHELGYLCGPGGGSPWG